MFTSWKTTLAGLAVGFINLWANGISAKQAALSVGVAALGVAAKDLNVTGGTTPQ